MVTAMVNELMPRVLSLIAIGGIIILGISLVAWWLIMLIEALRFTEPQWKSAGHNQILYVAAMIFLGLLGTILYVVIPRPLLKNPVRV